MPAAQASVRSSPIPSGTKATRFPAKAWYVASRDGSSMPSVQPTVGTQASDATVKMSLVQVLYMFSFLLRCTDDWRSDVALLCGLLISWIDDAIHYDCCEKNDRFHDVLF